MTVAMASGACANVSMSRSCTRMWTAQRAVVPQRMKNSVIASRTSAVSKTVANARSASETGHFFSRSIRCVRVRPRSILSRISATVREDELREKQAELENSKQENKEMDQLKALGAYVGLAVAFGAVVWGTVGSEAGEQYFAGYLLEQSLSVDNLFVFLLVFKYFETTPEAQSRALSYGLYGAAGMRLALILAGSAAVEHFRPVLLVFAAILLFSSYKLLTEEEEEDEDLSDNALVNLCKKFITVSDDYDGDKFFTLKDGVRTATPLLLVVAVIELSDVVFAVDSIPAVFGVTTDPFIVYSSNMFALLSLRALFAFVSEIVAELEYLQTAVACVLGFIGAKLIAEVGLNVEVPTLLSLQIVASLLGGGVAASFLFPSEKKKRKALEEKK
eukprot:CAMPEP_0114245694 /NCGR_PEP_ID=MMETSP0058-20121206/12045_1 /TAXON_ID=36894 /ORGANISM="Pyramimonas parkeae, CCMP726" /LENGTH=388 /DNA_ID=CAMNT_0001358789 /DNA_START=387 /DNA_END=1553 /DNA_ORIENTATION=-